MLFIANLINFFNVILLLKFNVAFKIYEIHRLVKNPNIYANIAEFIKSE